MENRRRGRRRGAGRKRAPENVGLQPHCARPAFVPRAPVHVTMRAVRGVSTMRAPVVARAVMAEIARASDDGFRVLHFSVQNDHLHLIAEGDDGPSFSRGMQRLASRVARRHVVERYIDERIPELPRRRQIATVIRPHEKALRARSLDLLASAPSLDHWRAEDAFFARLEDARTRAGPRTR